MSPSIPLCVPELSGRESQLLLECVESNFVSSVGPFVERFECAFATYVGARHAVACSTGTAALHVALQLAGVSKGDSVAVSTLTFIASANAISYRGADSWLIDSESRTGNMDTERLFEAVVHRAKGGMRLPKAIEVVHVLGHPVDIEPVLRLRDEFGIAVIEDAAESLGATYAEGRLKDRQVGTIGDVGCYSFNGNKIITTGGGGMIVTDDDDLAARARHLTTQAKLPGREYCHDEVGYNYRLTNVAAALGVAQLERLDEFLAVKRRIAEHYRAAFAALDVEGPVDAHWANPSYWLSSVQLGPSAPGRARILDALEQHGVGARPVWAPLHLQKPYSGAERLGGEVAERLHSRGLSLPSSVGLSESDQDRVIEGMRAAIRGV